MLRSCRFTSFIAVWVIIGICPALHSADDAVANADDVAANKPQGLGAPGELAGIEIGPPTPESVLVIRGRDARQQVVVTGLYSSQQQRDLTQQVEYSVTPTDIVSVDKTGLITPLQDGEAVLNVTGPSGKSASVKIQVSGIAEEQPIDFHNQIVPIFTKLGCNGGGCHGKSGGQNGFRLSLLGFYPDEDYEFLVKEGRGRRLFPPAPDESLLLKKSVGTAPHGGGKRMTTDSYEYRILARWIQQGMPRVDEPRHVTKIECFPDVRVMDRHQQQQITVTAHYSDGTTEDVTRMAVYEANDTEMAEAGKTGMVATSDLIGEVAIMARYQSQVATFRATIPLGAEVANLPASDNIVDQTVFNKLKVLGIPPSPVADDSTFLRRVYIDITGTLPTVTEVEQFLADTDTQKRDKLVDQLLETTAYADYFATKWNAVLRNKKQATDTTEGTYAFHQWIWSSLYDNKPYSQLVSEILTASGQQRFNPAVVWYREVNETNEQVEDTAQLFLGIRIQCARCHHHPFEKWSQNDYYSFAAFFSRLGKKKPLPNEAPANSRDTRLFHNTGMASAKNPRSGTQLKPAGLGSQPLEIDADRDPRQKLAEWMSDPQNPFFAPALVNRYWKHFFSRGLVEPEDDMRATNPPSNPDLLNALSQHFIDSGFDLKELIRTICKSKTYQLSTYPNEYNLNDKQNYSRFYPKRLTAEVLYDAFHQVTGSTQSYSGLPPGTRAIQLPNPSVGPYFLKVFGQPQSDTACECERSQEANLAQSLHLLNSSEVQQKVSLDKGRAALLSADKRPHNERIRELYLWVYAREPKPDELQFALAHIEKHPKSVKTAYEDIVWALVNTKEFLFNH